MFVLIINGNYFEMIQGFVKEHKCGNLAWPNHTGSFVRQYHNGSIESILTHGNVYTNPFKDKYLIHANEELQRIKPLLFETSYLAKLWLVSNSNIPKFTDKLPFLTEKVLDRMLTKSKYRLSKLKGWDNNEIPTLPECIVHKLSDEELASLKKQYVY